MSDSRIPLNIGTKLLFENGPEYEIAGLIGRGANCFVYDASYKDQVNMVHLVRIKELYPVYLPVKRGDDGSVYVEADYENRFEESRERFLDSYKKNAEIQNLAGLTNSTSNAQELFNHKGTYYGICAYDEGCDYSKLEEENLYELLSHIKALAKVVQRYHESGYLHLDIKPENIYIIPETAEHIMLFDFDSVTSLENLRNGTADFLSYSEGFSSPEQIRGNTKRIDTWSDVYSIGAVLYYKLFGAVPEAGQMQVGNRISFAEILFDNDLISPKLYKLLEIFLRKTLSLSSHARWKTVDLLIQQLDQMLPLAMPGTMFIADHFTYHEKCFVGRSSELSELYRALTSNQVVFLSGIGGIGKTEIAKRYAFCYRKYYNTVVFLRFDGTLKNTLLSSDLDIRNFEFENNEDTLDLFEAKLKALKKLAAEDDLLIIDNFDVDEDEDLERLLECKCKFLFTTREDFRDYNYEQVDVTYLDNLEDTFELFFAYNDHNYNQEEKKAIGDIMAYVDYHTMMIVLLAKYLRDSEEAPSCLYAKFLEVEGTANTSDDKVKHRKDKKLTAQKVNKHLQLLFDFSAFTERELRIMQSLSLLGAVRIQQNKWIEMVGSSFQDAEIERLVKKGWIESEQSDKGHMISLHQIILDLVYNEHTPNTLNCEKQISGYITYLQKPVRYRIDKMVQKNIGNILLDRIQGDNYLFAMFLYVYCKKIKWETSLLKRAQEICMRECTSDAAQIHAKTIVLELDQSYRRLDFWDKDHEEIKTIIHGIYQDVQERKAKVSQLISASEGENSLEENCCEILLDFARATCNVANCICMNNMVMDEGKEYGFDALFHVAEELILNLEQVVLKENPKRYSYEFKETLLLNLEEFYNEEDFTKQVQADCVGDAEKSAVYTEELNALRHSLPENANTYYVDGTSYLDAGDQAWLNEQYQDALALYEKALALEESVYDDIMFRICEVYKKLHFYEEAEKGLLSILEYDRRNRLDPAYTFQDLIFLYKELGDEDKLRFYSNQLLQKKINESPMDNAEWVIMAIVEMLLLEKEASDDGLILLFRKYLKIAEHKEFLDTRMVDTLLSSLESGIAEIEDVHLIYRIANHYTIQKDYEEAKRLYQSLLKWEQIKTQEPDLYLCIALWLAGVCIDGWEEDHNLAAELLLDIVIIIQSRNTTTGYLLMKARALIGKLRLEPEELPAPLAQLLNTPCDYYLITRNDLNEVNASWTEQFQMWSDTIDLYTNEPDRARILLCLRHLKNCLLPRVTSQGLKEYMERVLSAKKYLRYSDSIGLKQDLKEFLCLQFEKRSLKEDELLHFIKTYCDALMKNGDMEEGISIYGEYLQAIITDKVPEVRCFLEQTFEFWKSMDTKSLMNPDLDVKTVNTIVGEIESMVSMLENYSEYGEACQKMKEIKMFYEGGIIQFKH